jgi:amino acid adenylation domain-containing protein
MLDETRCAYNTGLYTEISGELDPSLLNKAAAYVVGRTESLRLRFHAADDDLWQEVLDVQNYVLPVIDLTQADDPRAAGVDLIERDLRTAIQLRSEPPFRWLLIRTEEKRWLWGQIYHHIALDGQSAWIVSNRVSETYSALREGRPLPDYPAGGTAALTSEELSYRLSPRMLEDRRYWESCLGDSERMRSWPSNVRRASSAAGVVRETRYLPALLSARLRELARQAGLRPEHLLMAAAAILQSVYQGQQDIVLGTQLLGRLASSANAFPAMASNECHIRLAVSPALEFEALAKDISRQMRLALRHQSYRYEDLRNDLGLLPGDPDIFGLSVNMMPVNTDLQFHGLESSSHYLSFGPVRDLSLTLFDNKAADRLRLDLDGNGALHRRSDLQEHLTTIVSIIEQAASAPIPVGAFALPGATVKRQTDRARTGDTTDRNATLPDLIAVASEAGRAGIALTCGDISLTYDELDKKSNRLARYLIHRGVGPEALVGIGLRRSPEMIVAVLAVLKAGAACLPLDPDYPAGRLSHMLKDSGAGLVLTRHDGADIFAAHDIPLIAVGETEAALADFDPGPLSQDDRTSPLHAQNLAFLIYTSGSTGRPKGVGLTHRNLVNKLLDQVHLWDVGRSSRFAFSSSINFDPSVHQMLLPLVAGGICVVLSPDEASDPDLFLRRIAESGVTHLDVVPSFAAIIADHAAVDLPDLRAFILGGDVLPAPLLNRLRARLPECRFFNMYGPTETCVDATAFEISAGFSEGPVPIGRALHGYDIHVLDECLRPLPVGTIGEIYISGTGVARGYWRRPGLTAERFLPCPFGEPGARMYRTGDRGYCDADGDLVFCGRTDEQIKLRGIRIELTEIEAALMGQAGVEQAAVVLDENGMDARLVAYIAVAPGIALNGPDLRKTLADTLPAAMIPSAIEVLETLPLLPNGKLDRKSLPKIRQDHFSDHVEPDTELEACICALFGSLTGIERVSVLDNFFALGGHSLMAMRLVSRLRTDHGREVPIELVFTTPTARALAAAISARGPNSPSTYDPVVPLRESGSLRPLFCVHPAAGLAHIYGRMADTVDARIPLYGLQARGIYDDAPPHDSILEMAGAYVAAVRSLQPRGPYCLAGWSFGGVVAHAMAGLLETEGETVDRLFLIDSYFSAVESDVTDPGSASVMAPAGASEFLIERTSRAFVRSSRLIESHTARKIHAPVVFFRARDNVTNDLRASLEAMTGGIIEIEDISAGHYSLFDPVHANAIGAALNRHMTG